MSTTLLATRRLKPGYRSKLGAAAAALVMLAVTAALSVALASPASAACKWGDYGGNFFTGAWAKANTADCSQWVSRSYARHGGIEVLTAWYQGHSHADAHSIPGSGFAAWNRFQ